MPVLVVNTHIACNSHYSWHFCSSAVPHAPRPGKYDQPTFQLAQASVLMKELISLRAKQPGLPIVICGDFNSNRKSLLREYFLFGMPEPKDGATLALSADGPFSAVWTREFNKKIERGHSEEDGRRLVRSVWKEDCYPWQQLWYGGPDSPFASERSKIVPLMDAFEELHDSRLAYTVPGEKNNDGNNMILDHMCVLF